MPAGELAISLGVFLGPVAWAAFLNLQDRRRSAIYSNVMKEFTVERFRGRVAVQIRPGRLSRQSVVRLEVLDCAQDEIGDVLARLSRVPGLVPTVSLDVKWPAGQPLTTFTAVTTRQSPTRLTEPHSGHGQGRSAQWIP